jgi:hypothetical protein
LSPSDQLYDEQGSYFTEGRATVAPKQPIKYAERITCLNNEIKRYEVIPGSLKFKRYKPPKCR